MNVLLIGAGGREHALAAALAKSPKLGSLTIAPGNPGTAALGRNVALALDQYDALLALAQDVAADLVVIGPEAPLVAGLTDQLEAAGFTVFGPSRAAAMLEGSKGFTKDLCRAERISTAHYGRFDTASSAKTYLSGRSAPIVVKADGLAAGKGVVIAESLAEAEAAVDIMFGGTFGQAGTAVVIEEHLKGEEVSFFALCDGTRALAFGSAQDHKRVGEGETGPNTGGMGAISPAPAMTAALEAQILSTIIAPTLRGMAARGTPFRGMLFAGLMIVDGRPQLIEYNVRFGDPETQVILPRLDDDLLPLLLAAARGSLPAEPVRFIPGTALTVVMAAKNYPGPPLKGTVIGGLAAAALLPGVTVFQAGTVRAGEQLLADGGRVLAVTALGGSAREAQARAYAGVDAVTWPGGFCRRDIGWQAVAREQGGRNEHSGDLDA